MNLLGNLLYQAVPKKKKKERKDQRLNQINTSYRFFLRKGCLSQTKIRFRLPVFYILDKEK